MLRFSTIVCLCVFALLGCNEKKDSPAPRAETPPSKEVAPTMAQEIKAEQKKTQ